MIKQDIITIGEYYKSKLNYTEPCIVQSLGIIGTGYLESRKVKRQLLFPADTYSLRDKTHYKKINIKTLKNNLYQGYFIMKIERKSVFKTTLNEAEYFLSRLKNKLLIFLEITGSFNNLHVQLRLMSKMVPGSWRLGKVLLNFPFLLTHSGQKRPRSTEHGNGLPF